MAVIVDIDHNAGNLNEYDSTVTDEGDLSAHADAALAGTTYGLQCVIDDTTTIYGAITTFGAQPTTDLRFRFYIDINTLTMADYDVFTILKFYLSNAPWTLVNVQLQKWPGGLYKLICIPYNDAGALSTDLETVTDAPHYVEIYIHRSAAEDADDGTVEWWIDGVSKGTWTSVDNYDAFALWNLARFGCQNIEAGTSGTLFLDELKINDDGGEIGPVVVSNIVPILVNIQNQ